MILLFYFILLFFYLAKSRSVAIFLVLIQIVSLSGIFFIGKDFPTDSLFKLFNILITGLILTIIILPWRKIKGITDIYTLNEEKIKKLTKILLVISGFTFIILTATTIFVYSVFSNDINTFKYAEGVSKDFYYSLPLNIKLIILSTYFYYFSYFLIPLHFYYLAKKKYSLSILCFIFSLNIMLYGLTYFSRAAVVHYILLYTSFVIILYGTLSVKIRRYIKKTIIIFGCVFSIYFFYVTNNRFTQDKIYENNIPSNAIIKDPVVYSVFDYLSQWFNNNLVLLNSYEFKTFNGQTSLKPVLDLLGQYGIINYNPDNYHNLQVKLWLEYWYTFNGFVAYSIYDYGYFFTMLFSILYYLLIVRFKPSNGRISLLKLFVLILLIQLPLEAIFYSTVSGIIIPFLLFIPILFYLKTTITKKTIKINSIKV